MISTPPLETPPARSPSSSFVSMEKTIVIKTKNQTHGSQRSYCSKDSSVGDGQGDQDTSPFVRLDQLEAGGLQSFPHDPASISFWFPRRQRDQRDNHDQHRDRTIQFPGRRTLGRRADRHHQLHYYDNHHHQRRRGPGARGSLISSSAIQPGKPVDIFTSKQLGLLVNFAALGYFDGMIPLLTQALYVAGSPEMRQLVDLRHLVVLLRVVFALLSDTVFASTATHRRRVFLVLGWATTLTLCAILVGIAFSSSATSGTLLVDQIPTLLLLLLPIGHVVAGVSADALMVEYAHREDQDERGCIPMLLLATRAVGELIGRSFVSTGNVPTPQSECQGALECVLPLRTTFILAACVAFIALLSAAFITHVPSRSRLSQGYAITVSPLTSKLRQTWRFHQSKAFTLFTVFAFLQTASFAWTSPTAKELARDWIQLSVTSRCVSDGIARASQMIASLLMLALWRNTDWRATMFGAVVVATLATELPASLLTLLDKTRSQTLFLAAHHIATLCEGLLSMIRLLITVEMAMPHMEATSVAVSMSVFDLGTIAGSFVANKATSIRPTSDVRADSKTMEWIAIVSMVLFIARLLVNTAGIWLLPRQKAQLQETRDAATANKTWTSVSTVVFGMLFSGLLTCVVFNVHALSTSTTGVPWASSLLFTFQ